VAGQLHPTWKLEPPAKPGRFRPAKVNKFNGGLFAPDPALDALKIPNSIFYRPGQGQNEASLFSHTDTLLYLCASYNYASSWAPGLKRAPLKDQSGGEGLAKSSLGLYTLGRIFEQSITELEILEAEADGRLSVNDISKRKRDGVYYTPEWVVERIIDETLTPRLDEIKRECGWAAGELPNLDALDAYEARLKAFKVVDPACGSGAFLITTLRYLVDSWRVVRDIRAQLSRVADGRSKAPSKVMPDMDDDRLIRSVIANNIYGVDINPASVEIARLALWLHTASGDRPLSTLDASVRDGNSLIDDGFFNGQIDLALYDAEARERVNAFDWWAAFPEVEGQGGFDAVVGNPPYVKLQNFKRVHPDMAQYLRAGPKGLDAPPYVSTRTGNFDLYLAFIERGVALLNDNGRLGYIAPSLWTVTENGAGLRAFVAKNRTLDRWIDFRAHQIFDEATTYTALMFFTKRANDAVRIVTAPDGVIPADAFANNNAALPYARLSYHNRWLMVTGPERDLIDRLAATCRSLGDPMVTANVFVGLQTSADSIYHMERIGPGRFRSFADPDRKKGYEVAIEDALMKPLVSGVEAKRYQTPTTNTYILFAYSLGEDVTLIEAEKMARQYPNAWAYLRTYEAMLRRREAKLDKKTGDFELDDKGVPVHAPFNDNDWYRFGRHQNLDKQQTPKLIVGQTVPSLRVCFDDTGSVYLNNVRVNGILPAKGVDAWFLLGVLNTKVADFVFRRIAKVKDGGFYEANRQFIEPLPIPEASDAVKADVATKACALQQAHTRRRDLLGLIAARLKSLRPRAKPATWLFPTIKTKLEWEKDAPKGLDAVERAAFADKRFADAVAAAEEAVGERLKPGVTLEATFAEGELTLTVDGVPVISGIFLDDAAGSFVLAQWRVLSASFTVTEKSTGKSLCDALRKLADAEASNAAAQLMTYQAELTILDGSIRAQEAAMNAAVYQLYRLTETERALVEGG